MSHQIAELRQKRHRIFQHMEETLCGGDMNVQLTPQPGMAGNSTTLREGERQTAQDTELLVDCLAAQQMTALNTWTGQHNAAYTYEQGQVRTHWATSLPGDYKPHR